MTSFPALPPTLKGLTTFMKIASDMEKTDPVVSYWCRMYCVQNGIKIENKTKDVVVFLTTLMDWLEKEKKSRIDNEAITNDMVGQAHVENYALQLFNKADTDDREGRASKNTSRIFLIASQLFEILTIFGEVPEDITRRLKYAKWKAIYISRCLKNGETPVPGPVAGTDADELYLPEIPSNDNSDDNTFGTTQATVHPSQSIIDYPTPGTTDQTVIKSNLSSDRSADLVKARKFCNFAGSALQYEDIPTAVDYLEKALALLTTEN